MTLLLDPSREGHITGRAGGDDAGDGGDALQGALGEADPLRVVGVSRVWQADVAAEDVLGPEARIDGQQVPEARKQ